MGLLLDNGADIKLLTALNSGGSRDTLSGRTAQSYTKEVLNSNGMWSGRHTTLYRAAYKGHPSVVRVLLERGADVHAHGCARSSAMHAVAISGNAEVMQLLLKYGGTRDVNAVLKTVETTPLHYAVENGNYEVVKLLLDNGADIKKRQKFSYAKVMHFAPWQAADSAIVALLLERGAEVNIRDSHYRRPLHLFVQRHARPEAVELILNAGAKIDGLNSLRQTALDIAIDCDCDRCMGSTQVLLSHGALLRNPYGSGRKNHPELFKDPAKSWDPLDRLAATSSIGSDDSLPSLSATNTEVELGSLDERDSLAESTSMMERLSMTPSTLHDSETDFISAIDSKLDDPVKIASSEATNAYGIGIDLQGGNSRTGSDFSGPSEKEEIAEEASIVATEDDSAEKTLRKRDRFRAKMKRMVS